MKNLENIHKNFTDWLTNLNTEEYWEEFDTYFKSYLLDKKIDINKFNSENELKKYLQDFINFFTIEDLWNNIAKKIWVKYCKEISEIFHKRIDELMIKWKLQWKDIDSYEVFLEIERKKIQNKTWINYNFAVSDLVKNNIKL